MEPPCPPADVWPPPPTGMPVSAAPSAPAAPAFSPIQRLAQVIIGLLAIDIGLSVYAGLSAALHAPTAAFLTTAAIIAFVHFLLLLVTGLCFFIWTYRLDKNLRALGASGLEYRPGWAVGYFFVPIMNLYRPYQAFCEIWQASDPSPEAQTQVGRRSIRVPALLGFWWGFWLLYGVVNGLAAQDKTTLNADAAGLPFRFIAALLAIFVVRLFTARQQKTARQLSLIS